MSHALHIAPLNCMTWQEQGGGWKFQTKRQVWILKHMYTESTIDKKFFKKLVLPYVSTLQGGAKEVRKGVARRGMRRRSRVKSVRRRNEYEWPLSLLLPLVHLLSSIIIQNNLMTSPIYSITLY